MSGKGNGAVIEAEIAWFTAILDLRFRIHGGEVADEDPLLALPPPLLPEGDEHYAAGLRSAALNPAERLVLILALLPYLRPQALDAFMIANSHTGRPFTEFGGVPAGARSGFLPTRETALFLLAGESMEGRLRALPLFAPQAPLQAAGILEQPEDGEFAPWTALVPHASWLERLTVGAPSAPRYGAELPAQPLETPYEWPDLVLPQEVRAGVEDIVAWVEHEPLLMGSWGLSKHLKRGYRALFHGPPGTGKTLTAALLGKRLGRPVYRIDLSRVVSKWIGETEKNLGALFDRAAAGDTILFFDEADALFGRRGETRTANDRHANQQVAYLLQRVEDCPGLVILASNLRENIDRAFARRFQATLLFPMPDAAARLSLWKAAFAPIPPEMTGEIDLRAIARDHELSGGAIVNVLRHAAVQAVKRDPPRLDQADLRQGIRLEREKEGHLFS